jgi:NAD(P)-dependent dehydrogenase (short-subunit alcohol dehydrogenase family)
MSGQYEGKVVLITGGGGGIGKAAARRFLDEGASVVLSGTRAEVLEAAQRELGASDRIATRAGAITTRAQAHDLVRFAIGRFGAVDVLVNSTGIFRPVPFLEQTEEHMEEALGSILYPTYWVSQAVALAMRDRGAGGAIVNVGSMWAVDAIATTPTSAYSAAQAGRHALTKNLAIELAGDRIRVNAVALAFVETPAYERFMTPDEAQAVLDSVDSFHPLGRRGQASDVAEAVLFLAGDGARWITGTTLPVDGGVLAGRSPAVVAEAAAA